MANNNTFRKLPSELRTKLFGYILRGFEWEGKMPAIIKAIRVDPEIYYEALTLFIKGNHTFILSERNEWSFGDMTKEIIGTIGKVTIEVSPLLYTRDFEHLSLLYRRAEPKMLRLKRPSLPPTFYRAKLQESAAKLWNVRQITLKWRPGESWTIHWKVIFANDICALYRVVAGFSKLEKITLHASFAKSLRKHYDSPEGIIEAGNFFLGVEAVFGKDAEGRDKCVWEAEQGEQLKEVIDHRAPRGIWRGVRESLKGLRMI